MSASFLPQSGDGDSDQLAEFNLIPKQQIKYLGIFLDSSSKSLPGAFSSGQVSGGSPRLLVVIREAGAFDCFSDNFLGSSPTHASCAEVIQCLLQEIDFSYRAASTSVFPYKHVSRKVGHLL